MTPVTHRVVTRRQETETVVSLGIEPLAAPRMSFAPGQFNMLYAYAIGEAPVSISGNPLVDGPIVHTVRDVGAVSHALCALREGDTLGIRGPFGGDWGVEGARGGDLVMIAGGIGLAPLRSAITQVLEQRSDFRRVDIVIGARTPQDLLFGTEVESWRDRGDVSVHVTVDRSTRDWRGDVGVVTTVVPRLALDPSATAMLCGPEIMMRVTALALLDRGLGARRIRASLERNMACATKLCGHCQLGSLFVCADGPVLTWDRIAPLLAVREL